MVNVKPNQKLANTRTYHVTTIRVATVKGKGPYNIYDIHINKSITHSRPGTGH